MKPIQVHFLDLPILWLVLMSLPAGRGWAVDPVMEMKSFSAFSKFELPTVSAPDKVFTETGTVMKFPRGLCVQAYFLAMAPAEKTARLFRSYDGSAHEFLRIFLHFPFPSPVTDRDLAPLEALSGQPTFQKLMARSRAIKKERTKLNLTLAEAAQVLAALDSADKNRDAAARCWGGILKGRAGLFQKKGLAGLPPYENGEEECNVDSEVRDLLREEPAVEKQFSSFLSTTLFARNSSSKAYQYLEFLDVDSHPNFNLGATWLGGSEGKCQIVDCVYYSSGGFYVSCDLCQVWPLKWEGKEASLVWQEKFVSSPTIADLKGLEAIAAPGIMAQELKKSIRAFREDLEGSEK